MRVNRKYLVAVVLLAVLAVVFGLAGTVTPVADSVLPQQSSSDSVTHFANPPTYDSGWVNITNKCGQYFTLNHGLNTTEVVVDITGKQSLDPKGGALVWSRPYGGADYDRAWSMVQTNDGGYALAGQTNSSGAGYDDFWLVKTDENGNMQWSRTYGGAGVDEAKCVVQTDDGGYALAGYTTPYGAVFSDFWMVKTDSAGNMEWSKTYGVELGSETAYGVVQTSDGGYAVAGSQTIPPAFSDFWLVKTDVNGNMQWNKTYDDGGRDDIAAGGVVQTSDGGYAIAGYSGSLMWGDVADFWLVKTDVHGNAQWNGTYGGASWDFAYGVVQTIDGGYAVIGGTRPDPTPLSHAVLLIKTDQGGNMAWNRTFGGAIHDHAFSVIETSDGGYALAGFSSTDAGDVYTYTDFLLVRTDSVGNLVWNGTYGGADADFAYSVVQTGDGGYALGGVTESFGSGGYDAWLVKVEGDMNLEHKRNLYGTMVIPGWSQTYGGTSYDYGKSVVQTFDGGYTIGGYTNSFDIGNYDFWLVKTDAGGNTIWSKTYGGTETDYGYSVVQTGDGGYALAGYTSSYAVGLYDFWLVKTDSAGNMEWSQTYGGTHYDYAVSVIETRDKGYAITGFTQSFGAGGRDFWLVKTDSAGNMEWSKTYGGAGYEWAYSLVQTSDRGYALAGYTNSYGAGSNDFWLVKTDSAGNMQWNKTYGGTFGEVARSMVQTHDGGYALAGETLSYGAGSNDFWLVKTDSGGNMQWSRAYGGTQIEVAYSLVLTVDGGYAMVGNTNSFGAGYADLWLVKTDSENGLTVTALANFTITLYRGRNDPYWNYVRVRIWTIEEPTWQFGDINQDGVVDINDLAIIGKNYGKTFSLLSLTGLIAIAGIHTYKKRKQPK